MRVRTEDGRVLEGTPLQITRDMKMLDQNHAGSDLVTYLHAVATRLKDYARARITVREGTSEEMAEHFVQQLLTTGVLEDLNAPVTKPAPATTVAAGRRTTKHKEK